MTARCLETYIYIVYIFRDRTKLAKYSVGQKLSLFQVSYFYLDAVHCTWLQGIKGSFQGFPVVRKPCNIYSLRINPIIIMGFPLQSVNITGFIHIIHRVSLQFLQPFSIDSVSFPCRDPVIPSPRSFHGVRIWV